MNIQFKQCNSTNYRVGRIDSIKYIIIHYTANVGDTAKNNIDYFARQGNLSASAHYFVDSKEIWQSVKDNDTAWAVGDGNGKYGITNANSISIELCDFVRFNEQVALNALPLIRDLMQKYNVPVERVVRHYDASRKLCPLPFVQNEQLWNDYKGTIISLQDNIKEEPEMKVEFVGSGKDVKVFVGDKEITDSVFIEVNSKTHCFNVAEAFRALGHTVEWRSE